MGLVFVDCEAWGGCPAVGQLTEFGAVCYDTRDTFHGVLAVSEQRTKPTFAKEYDVFSEFTAWLNALNQHGRPIFVSDNVAFDWQWINDGFWRTLGKNPFGHSGRRIGDFAAGLAGDFTATQAWKQLRVTKHDHNPVNDAMGNVEAFAQLIARSKELRP